MKKPFVFFAGIAALALAGCSAVEQQVDQVTAQAEQRVQQEVDKATAGVRAQVDQKVNQAQQDLWNKVDPNGQLRDKKARLDEAQTMMTKIEQGQVFDPAVQQWIQKTVAESDQAVRAFAMPVMTAAYEKFPEKRKWLEAEVQKAMQGTEGPVKQAWQDVLDAWTRVSSVTQAQQ